jgi:hypothetical protein
MTRISGCFILCCPHCGAWFRTPNYVSMNFMAMESWTDGYQAYSLMPRSEYMRHCTSCDQLYDRSEAIRIDQFSDEEMHDTVELPASSPRHWLAAAWRKVAGAPAPKWEKKLKDSLPPPVAWLPLAQTQQRLEALIENGPNKNPKAALFELELRIRLWQQGNDWYREGYLHARKTGATVPPEWSVSDAQAQNLRRITDLLQDPKTKSHDQFLLVDAYRELGDFDKAALALNKVDASGTWLNYQKTLIEKRMSHVGLYP